MNTILIPSVAGLQCAMLFLVPTQVSVEVSRRTVEEVLRDVKEEYFGTIPEPEAVYARVSQELSAHGFTRLSLTIAESFSDY